MKSIGPPLILLGSDCLTGLQIARILWRRGVPVFGVADQPRSAYCRSRAVVETVEDQGAAGLRSLLDRLRVRYEGLPILLPCTDRSVAWLASLSPSLSGRATVLLPIGDTLDQLGDKAKFHEIASAAGWPVPETRIVREPSDLARVAAEISLPLAVKPPRRSPAWRAANVSPMEALSSE